MHKDQLSDYYADYLDGSYDCVDRIVLNAYFQQAQSPGGFRVWWRILHGGDEKLDKEHIAEYAGRFAGRVKEYAKTRNIPLIESKRGDQKHKIAERLIPSDPKFRGLFCIIVGRCPSPVWDVERFGKGGIHLFRQYPMPYVNNYSFHYIDKEFGHVTFKLCPYPAFTVQIILNGHEYMERELNRRRIAFSKNENCFTGFSDSAELAKIAAGMKAKDFESRLIAVCDRWIYTGVLCFALERVEQDRTNFRYSYSVYQLEYSRNLLFRRGREMEQIFEGLIDRTRSRLDMNTVKTIFGAKRRPFHTNGQEDRDHVEIRVERHEHGLIVFKICYGALMVKMYTKGRRVLRAEITVHNAKRFNGARGIGHFSEIVEKLSGMLARFLDALHCMDVCFIDGGQLEKWSRRSKWAGNRVAGINVNDERMQLVMKAVVTLSGKPGGFKASELAKKIRESGNKAIKGYTTRQASYDTRKLRAKKVVEKIEGTHKYQGTVKGLKGLNALLVLRNEVLLPLLSKACERSRGPKIHMSEIQVHYDNIQKEMQSVFKLLGIAA